MANTVRQLSGRWWVVDPSNVRLYGPYRDERWANDVCAQSNRTFPPAYITATEAKDEAVLQSDEIDLTVAAEINIPLPAGVSKFFTDEVGVLCSQMTGVVAAQPTISWGNTANKAKIKAAEQMTLLTAADKREVFSILLTDDGEANLAVEITVPGALVGTGVYKGRVYIKGMARA